MWSSSFLCIILLCRKIKEAMFLSHSKNLQAPNPLFIYTQALSRYYLLMIFFHIPANRKFINNLLMMVTMALMAIKSFLCRFRSLMEEKDENKTDPTPFYDCS